MILWTIHNTDFWEKLKEKKILRTDGRWADPHFREAYQWMAQQMRLRLPHVPPRSIYPLWAWYQFDGIKRRKPDLRSSGHLSKGTGGVRIEFEIDDREVLLSDFMDWHCVLGYHFLSDSVEELDIFYEELEREGLSKVRYRNLPPHFKERIRKSWEHIFDLNFDRPMEEKAIQATFWELRLESVRDVREFVAR